VLLETRHASRVPHARPGKRQNFHLPMAGPFRHCLLAGAESPEISLGIVVTQTHFPTEPHREKWCIKGEGFGEVAMPNES
jgi:hypothetical protein